MGAGSRLVENIFSLMILRAAEYILAFLLVPYLLRVLGPTSYGAVAFMQGVVGYFSLFVNYGFNMTAPRDLAQAEEKDISTLFSTYFWAKFFLLLGVTAVFFIGYKVLCVFYPVKVDWPLFFAVYTSVLGVVLFPVWYFQGIQQMRYITILNLSGRIFAVVLLFLLVRSPEDYVWAALLQSCTSLVAGVLCWKFIYDIHPGILKRPVWPDLRAAYCKGWQVFLSTVVMNLYTTSDVVILGLLTNDAVVGYYSGADKLINCVKRIISSVNDAVYPYVSRVLQESRERGLCFLRRQLLIYTVCGIIGGAALYVLAPWGVPFLLGERYIDSIGPLQIMAFVPLVVAMSNVMGYETMLPLGMEKIYSRVLMAASILNLMIIISLISWGGAEGTAWAMLVTESFVTIAMAVVLWRRRILLR